MPKENVSCATSGDSRLEVRWRPDNGEGTGHVQVATVRLAPAEVTYLNLGNQPTGTTLSSTSTSPGPRTATDESNGWFLDLDRERINRLIRVLRRARDAAFGADA